uniref:SRCR domain-containing protein n=1 Tax=Accipiter nisus TaxID=211598 RepID=A0A8B9NHB1_9AVES
MRWAVRGTRNVSGTAWLRRSTTAATRKTPVWCAQVGPARAGSGGHQARFGLRWAEVSGRVQAAHPQLHPLPAEHQEWRLSGGRDGCAGRVEVFFRGTWSTVCDSTWYKLEASVLCRTLGCGEPLRQLSFGHTLPGKMLYQCESQSPDLIDSVCSKDGAIQLRMWRARGLSAQEWKETSSRSVTRCFFFPHPLPGPARLRLVDGDFGCSGFVELHRQGLWGAVAESPGIWPELATGICQELHCGTSIDSRSYAKPERGSHLPVRWEVAESCRSDRLLDCFNRTSARRGEEPAFIVCSQPQALRRLAAGPTPCEGDVEVFHDGQWHVLCDNSARRAEWGRQLCRELRCGNLSSSTEIGTPASMGVTCKGHNLHLCHTSFGALRTCSRTRVVCQDSKPRPAGTAAGTVASICLALLLFGILLLICGPPAYRRLMKRISKKKQRQWIGPTGLNQTVSFHRNSTVTLRPRAEGQRVQGGDNDYAQPPKKSSYLSAYPALEGTCRASNPPDNSSDSDYDLHSARRV